MAVKKIKVNGRWVWQARVAYRGLRKSTIRASKDEAKTAEATLRTALKEQRGQADQEAQAPATLRALFESYVVDLEHRGKGSDTIGRAIETAHVIERLMPDLLDRAVTTIGGADLFAFRKRRREGRHQTEHDQP
jgi:hypothetical protein